jgi:hypothetical protein
VPANNRKVVSANGDPLYRRPCRFTPARLNYRFVFDNHVGVGFFRALVVMRSASGALAGIELLSKHLKNYRNF